MKTLSRSLAVLSLAALPLSACARHQPPETAPPPLPAAPPRQEAWGGSELPSEKPPATSLVGDDQQAAPSASQAPGGSQAPIPSGYTPPAPEPKGTEVLGGDDPITVNGNASQIKVDALVRANRPELYKCAHLAGGKVKGKVVVSVDFDSGGTVRRVWIKESTLSAPAVEGCIARGPVRWHLDDAHGRAIVTFAMTFDGSE